MKIAAPIEKSICQIADQRILENWIMRKVGAGINTVKDLARDAAEPESVIRKAISRLIRKGDLTVDRSKKMHRFRPTERH
jgi:DNA-binding transcriptional regulator PaaX